MTVVDVCDGLMPEKSVSQSIGYTFYEISLVIRISEAVSVTRTPGRSRRNRSSASQSVDEKTPLM